MLQLLKDNNIWFFILSVFPALIYSFIIYKNSNKLHRPSVKYAWLYILMGLLSIQILTIIQFIFPHLQDYIQKHVTEFSFSIDRGIEIIEEPTLFAIFINTFVQIGLLEEFSKLLAFKTGHSLRHKKYTEGETLYSSMFYCAMISIGFAMFENIHYALSLKYRGETFDFIQTVLTGRSLNSVVLHMICGLFMGYFIAIGRTYKFWKRLLFTCIGLITAAIIHGYYDFNLSVPSTHYMSIFGLKLHIYNNILMIACIVIAFFMGRHLKNKGYYNPLNR